MTAICLKMAAKFKMAAKIEFLYIDWLCCQIKIKATPYYIIVTFYLHITHNNTAGLLTVKLVVPNNYL